MKITCDREKLLSAFQTAAGVAPSRSPKPILQNVKLEANDSGAIVMATDLEVGIRLEVEGIEVEAPGAAVLPVQRFGSILRESSDEKLALESDPQGTTVKGERSEFKLPGANPDEFPAITGFDAEQYIELSGHLLKSLIRRTLYATDTESTRYALGGVLLELDGDKMVGVGTDGRRLAKMEGPATTPDGYEGADTMTIVPSRAMQLIERAMGDLDANVCIAPRSNDVVVKLGGATIYARLVEGRFPPWREVFPSRQGAIEIDMTVGPIYRAVRQAAIVTSDESRGIDFQFGGGSLVLSGSTADIGQSRVELPIPYDGENITVSLDHRYMADFLKVLSEDGNFTLEVKDSDGAIVCRTEDGYGYVVMPLARDR